MDTAFWPLYTQPKQWRTKAIRPLSALRVLSVSRVCRLAEGVEDLCKADFAVSVDIGLPIEGRDGGHSRYGLQAGHDIGKIDEAVSGDIPPQINYSFEPGSGIAEKGKGLQRVR